MRKLCERPHTKPLVYTPFDLTSDRLSFLKEDSGTFPLFLCPLEQLHPGLICRTAFWPS